MKFKKFMFKVLRLKVMVPILIVIIAGAILLSYLFSGVKASDVDVSNLNLGFDFGEFKSFESVEEDLGYTDAEIAAGKYKEDALSGKYKKWVAQNDKYVMYFDEATTIIYVYQINEASKVGGTETHNGVSYPKIDITQCNIVYQSAKNSVDKSEGGNFLVTYADSNTGNTVSTELDTMTRSVFYYNQLTEETEHHYFTKDIDNGVQVFYAVGDFSAGNAYFPEKLYQTVYKPYKFEKEMIEDGFDKCYAAKPEKYEEAMEYWVKYMQMLGVEDPENASYETIQAALSVTYEQRFRGNALFKMNADVNNTTKVAKWSYSGTVTVYTVEGYEYMKKLIQDGTITADDDVDYGYDELQTATEHFIYGNARWKFKNVSQNFFEGEGVYYNCESSPIIVNTAIPSKFFEAQLGYGPTGGSTYAATSDTDNPFNFYYRKNLSSSYIKAAVYKMLYTTDNIYEDPLYHVVFTHADNDSNYVGGGILKVEDGKYVYGSDGKIEKIAYTLNLAAEDNARFGIETATVLPVFAFAVEFKLTDKGLSTTVLANSLIDSGNAKDNEKIVLNIAGLKTKIGDINTKYQILNITVLPQMTTSDSKTKDPVTGEDGYLLVPDGSGAIINFGNGKYELGYEGVNKQYYGSDNSFSSKAKPEDTKDLMLGMFGYVCTTAGRERGVLGIIEQGGSQNALLATTDQFKNCSYFKLTVRKNQEVKIGTGSGARPFYKLAKTLSDIDAKYLYMFLDKDELDYSTIAQVYKNYLIERDFGVDPATYEGKDKTRNTVVDMNFLGSFEKYTLLLGFKIKIADSLTTFDQAQEIIEELKDGVEVEGTKKKIQDYSVSYTAWTKEEMEYELGGKIKVNSVLGGLSSMKEFIEFLKTDGKSLYLENNITTTAGYDYSFGKLKFNARNVANEVATVYDYNPSTLRQDKKLAQTHYINPIYYINITNEVIGKLDKINKSTAERTGYFLNDLGNTTTNSYKSNEEVYGEKAIRYQRAALELLSESGKVKVKAPFDYAFKYVDEATNIPLTSTLSPIYDATIPFYQLVISGLFDYTTEDINGTSNNSSKWFYTKAIETGSNLSFVISAENPNILLDTDYTYYYQAYYQNWKEIIVDYTSKIDELGIHNGKLVYHESIGKNISFVQYKLYDGSGFINLCVNTTEADYTVPSAMVINGVTIPAGTVIPAYNYYKIA